MLFSDNLMSEFQSVEIPAGSHFNHDRVNNPRVFMLKSTPHRWIERAQALRRDPSDAGRAFAQQLHAQASSRWLGFGKQEKIAALDAGVIDTALEAFQKAQGGLETHFTRAAPVLAPVGTAFSIGRIIQGHPKAALYRPKAKLPAKRIEVCLSVSGSVPADQIAAQMSKIAKAIWQYSMAGGVVEFSVAFLCAFHQNQTWQGQSHTGFLDVLTINPSNAAQYSTAASGQFFRGFYISLAQALSGDTSGTDSLMCLNYNKPGVFQFTGYMKDADKVMEALRVK